jgi:hypothetical protein
MASQSERNIAIRKILESKLASKKLETVLRLFLNDFENDIYVDPVTNLVTIYRRDTKENFHMLCTLPYLIEEAARIGKYIGMTPVEFLPVGRALDAL